MTEVTPEARCLVEILARRGASSENTKHVDWDALVAVAESHGVGPLLYAEVRRQGLNPPEHVAASLRRSYLASAGKSTLIFHSLAAALSALHTGGVPVAPLKGAFLAEAVYGDIGVRPMSDVDIMVKSAHVARAIGILRGLGYRPEVSFDALAEQTINHGVPLTNPEGLRLDLHWSIVSPRCRAAFTSEELDALWSRAGETTLCGVLVLALSPTDLLLHLCVHASVFHRFDDIRLRHFVDIAQVCRRYGDGIAWDELAARANRWRVAHGVQIALAMSQEWAGAVVPASVLAALGTDAADEDTIDWVRQKVLHGTSQAQQIDALSPLGGGSLSNRLETLRAGVAPFRVLTGNLFRSPADSLRGLRDYLSRLLGFARRSTVTAWEAMRGGRTADPDTPREARLREYLEWR
jgi:hypothetical protein